MSVTYALGLHLCSQMAFRSALSLVVYGDIVLSINAQCKIQKLKNFEFCQKSCVARLVCTFKVSMLSFGGRQGSKINNVLIKPGKSQEHSFL